MKIGIFFGSRSREREISFASGRTIYDNIDKSVFVPIPVFVDSLGNFILLNWQNIYKGCIPDFYPDTSLYNSHEYKTYIESIFPLSDAQLKAHIDKVGKPIHPNEFSNYFDFAFLALHGTYGEDGTIQGLLEWYNIPYSGTSILGSSIGLDKGFQKDVIRSLGIDTIDGYIISRKDWLDTEKRGLVTKISESLGSDIVVKPALQGSSIGVSVVKNFNFTTIKNAIDKAFFMQEVTSSHWVSMSETDKKNWLKDLLHIIKGLGSPILIQDQVLHTPVRLLSFLERHFSTSGDPLTLYSPYTEPNVLVERYIDGREFSCIVLEEDDGTLVPLPPTEMIRSEPFLSYRDKYMPGAVNKVTPIDIPLDKIELITDLSCKVFSALKFQVYARIDGIITSDFKILINDPNTTVGMTPSSFLFHQAAEIGLLPSQLITFIIRRSLLSRMQDSKISKNCKPLLSYIDSKL